MRQEKGRLVGRSACLSRGLREEDTFPSGNTTQEGDTASPQGSFINSARAVSLFGDIARYLQLGRF